ncbi:MAG: hypothetical protein MIO90_04885 [Methanomassiliicoccales archaeon]|nr:hypothetical protein [Methanomassiliicoccales archaeon]
MRKDSRGIEGLPLRLMLVALLISMTMPVLLSSLGQASSDVSGRKLTLIAEDIARTVEEMAVAGPGNVRVVKMPNELPANMYIVIGGTEGSVTSMRLTWSVDGTELGSRYLNGASVLTKDGASLTLSAGDELRLACPLDAWGQIKVERI